MDNTTLLIICATILIVIAFGIDTNGGPWHP
jgi:hypothetical protein